MGLLLPALLALLLALAQLLPAAGRRPARAAQPGLRRLARPVHRAGPDRPARHRHRGRAWSGRSSRPRWRTGSSCAATSPTWPTTAPAAGSCWRGLLPLAALTALSVRGRRRWPPRPPAPGSTGPSSSARWPRRTATSTGCRPTSCTARPSPRRSCRPPRPATRAAPCVADEGPGTDWRCVVSPGTSPARPPSAPPSTSSTSPPTGATSPTATDPSEVNGFFQVRAAVPATRPTPSGSSTAPSTCSAPAKGLIHAGHPPTRRVRPRQPSGSSGAAPRPRVARRGIAALAVAGAGAAYASTASSASTRSARSTPTGLQVSADQIIKPLGQPPAHQVRQVHGLDGQPRRAVPRRVQHRQAVSSCRSSTSGAASRSGWSAAPPGVNQKLADGSVGQEGPTYSPDGKFLWLPQTNGLTRFAVNADGTLGAPTPSPCREAITPIPTSGLAALSALPGQVGRSPPTAPRSTPRSTARTPSWRSTRRPARSSRPGTSASRRASSSSSATSSTSATRAAARPRPARRRSTPTAPRCPPTRSRARRRPAPSASSTPPPPARRSARSPSACTRPRCTSPGTRCSSPTPTATPSRSSTPPRTRSCRPSRPSRGRRRRSATSPTSIAMTADGHLLVTLGRANAVAVYQYHGNPQEPVSYLGLLPTDYYPADVATVGDQVVVTNTRGIDARGPELTFNKGPGTVPATGHGTHSTTGVADPLHAAERPADRRSTPPPSSPRTAGPRTTSSRPRAEGPRRWRCRRASATRRRSSTSSCSSRRTAPTTRSTATTPGATATPTLAQFGEKVTPNQHALAKQFGLYDNFYDVGTNSAEGHNWLMQGDNPEYTESERRASTSAATTPRTTCSATSAPASCGPRSQAAGKHRAQLRRVHAVREQAGRRDLAAVLLRGQERRGRRRPGAADRPGDPGGRPSRRSRR